MTKNEASTITDTSAPKRKRFAVDEYDSLKAAFKPPFPLATRTSAALLSPHEKGLDGEIKRSHCAEMSITSVRVGLFLGMGPIAGARFYLHFEESFAGRPECEHPVVVCYSDPTIPRKDLSVEGAGPSALPYLLKGMDFFKKNCCDFVVAPCNTLMYYRQLIQQHSGIHIMDITDEVARSVKKNYSMVRNVGIMSTNATRLVGLYETALKRHFTNIYVMQLNREHQLEISKAIEDVKAGRHLNGDECKSQVSRAIDFLVGEGAQIVIQGCTELSCLSTSSYSPKVCLVDSSAVLAEAAAREIDRRRNQRGIAVIV